MNVCFYDDDYYCFTEDQAATRIQASFRGHQTRKKLHAKMTEEVIDIDLTDPGEPF